MALRQAAGGRGDRLRPGPVEKTPHPEGRRRSGGVPRSLMGRGTGSRRRKVPAFQGEPRCPVGLLAQGHGRGLGRPLGLRQPADERLRLAQYHRQRLGLPRGARYGPRVYLRRHDPAPDQGLALHPGLGEKRPGHQPHGRRSHPFRQKAGRQTDRRRSHPDQTGRDGRHLAAGQTGPRRPLGHGHDPRDHRGRALRCRISSGNGPSDSTS